MKKASANSSPFQYSINYLIFVMAQRVTEYAYYVNVGYEFLFAELV